ncbi:MAG: hypothetical protein AAF270_03770 [Pseudomonadota bacterium]
MATVKTSKSIKAAIVSSIAAMLIAGCSSGGEGDTVGFGSGQAPDPVALEFPIVYVQRPVTVELDDNGDPVPVMEDLRQILRFEIGADLMFRDRASPSTPDINITAELTQGLADIRDVTASYDAQRVAFAMRYPFDENLDEEEQVTWNLWEYEIPTNTLRRLIASDITAEAGHDIAPRYLPDGRIVFSSTRQRQSAAILLDEGKPQFPALDGDRNEPAFLLHTMQPDGSGIEQIGFNQSHELNPIVLDDGTIVFSRWDSVGQTDEINLYRMNPDGSGLELLYGANSHDVDGDGQQEQFVQPQILPDGTLVTLLKPFEGPTTGGALVDIDVDTYVENTQPTVDNAGMLGPAQTPATINNVLAAADAISPGGRYRSVYPLRDGTDRLLISWTQCRLQDVDLRILPCTDDNLADPTLTQAPSIYGIWIYDREDETQLPVVPPQEGMIFSDVVAAEPRATPAVLLGGENTFQLDPDIADEGVGVLNIRSVYDVLGADTAPGGIDALADPAQFTAAERPARFLRIEKAVSIPDEELVDLPNSAFGAGQGQGMREIIGYSMIEPDGSVMVKVPADVALGLSVVDGNGRRVGPRHQNWMQVRPGEQVDCTGCHDGGSGLSHGRRSAFASVHDGAVTTGQPYPNTDPALFADMGETMAEVRARASCSLDNCSSIDPSVNVVYEDVWTDEVAAGRARDASYRFTYRDVIVGADTFDGLDTEAPTTAACESDWTASCRTVIHYEQHLHALWSLPRQTLDVNGEVVSDFTCIACHSDRDAAGQLRVPIAQLDLSDGASDQEADHFKAYRELLFNDNEVELNMGALQDRLVQVDTDPVTGDPIFATVTVPSSMSGNGANSSARFFSRFEAGASHAGYLTPAELRLISEWLDIGGQYYNDPFAVPVD